MKNAHYDIYMKYYGAVVGRFYTKEQRRSLLRLFILSAGIDTAGGEYRDICDAVSFVEGYNVEGSTDSRNFKMLCGMQSDNSEVASAASAMSSVYEGLDKQRGRIEYKSFLDWVIKMRTTFPRTDAMRYELGYFAYSSGNTEEAIREFKALVNEGDLYAVEHLAFIYKDMDAYEEAYYYFLLLEHVYEHELRLPTSKSIRMHLSRVRSALPALTVKKIRKEINGIAPVLTHGKRDERPSIGFVGNERRRLTYEH